MRAAVGEHGGIEALLEQASMDRLSCQIVLVP